MSKTNITRDMLGREELTSVHEAQTVLTSHLRSIERQTETVTLTGALDRITSEDILSPEFLPPCNRSTMDGYAVHSTDTFGASQSMPSYLNVTGEVLMGEVPELVVTRGNCVKIPTGGIIPEGADAVMMLEHTVPIDDSMIEIVKDVGSGANIIKKGDDISLDDLAISGHSRLRPQDLGLLAGLGVTEVSVYRKVRIGIISTGDEIIPHEQPLTPGKTRNINSITIRALAQQHNASIVDYGIVSDNEDSFFSTVEQAVKDTDLVLFSGGSSVGMRDLGEQAISRLGSPGVLVHGVALKPGKPIIIGCCGTTPVFGLPGHPVSAAVCFDFFVKPVIHLLAGLNMSDQLPPATIKAVLKRNMNSTAGRLDLIRVRLSHENGQYLAYPVLGLSGAISSLSRAHGFFLIDAHAQGLQEETIVEVYPYL